MHEAQAPGGPGHAISHRDGQGPSQGRIDLDGDHPGSRLQDGQCERAEPRADLQDGLVGAHPGPAHDAPHGTGIVDEVLAKSLGGANAERRGQAPYGDGAEQARFRRGNRDARGGRAGVPGAACSPGGVGGRRHGAQNNGHRPATRDRTRNHDPTTIH